MHVCPLCAGYFGGRLGAVWDYLIRGRTCNVETFAYFWGMENTKTTPQFIQVDATCKTGRAGLTFQVWAFRSFEAGRLAVDAAERRRFFWDCMEHAERAGRKLRAAGACTQTVDALWLDAEAAALATFEL